MNKIAYVYKQKRSDAAWSSVISELGLYLQTLDDRVKCFHVDNTNRSSLTDSKKEIKQWKLGPGDLLIFNHAICFWLLFPLLLQLKRRGVRLIFLFHEHEHILGLSYCIKNLGKLRVKEWLRHLKLWYRIPFEISNHVVCLSSYQATVMNKLSFERLSYLGIDSKRFPPKPSYRQCDGRATVMFAHDPGRFDKGDRFYRLLQHNLNFQWRYGRDRILPYSEVYKKYHENDIIFLPSDSESYSLVFAEALATNCCIVTNTNVGIVQLLLSLFSIDELEKYGLFICEHNTDAYKEGLEKAARYIHNHEADTLSLFNLMKLDSTYAFDRFYSFIKRIGG
ncbi:hypothetical protein [Vibrio sp. 1640]|uniref:hypothetical protein n=1 Tax=Vibrio sp. 1640 TaxID=3074570 RepID=UPI0029642755|nr:hypothetical protein [Vibrio sp. 1640]MDW2080743.1 hypothetical protein [Vibrio sp. 1640]